MSAAAHVQLDGLFAQIPEPLLYDPAIPSDAVRVYGVLARHGADPLNCYPGHHRIATFIGKSPRSIQGWVRTLEEAGWITRVPRWRRGDEVTATRPEDLRGWEPTSNGYLVHATKRAGGRGVRAPQRVPLRAGERGGSALGGAPKESKENESHLEREPLAPDGAGERDEPALFVVPDSPPPSFDAFWALYPYKRGSRAAAERAWVQAVRKAPAAVILEGARLLAADPNLPSRAEARFVRHGSTWLRDRGWEDGPLPPRGGKQVAVGPMDSDRELPEGTYVPDPAAEGGWRFEAYS